MVEISLCMIVKNEENNLAVCLNSVSDLMDEINVVDTGSADKTVEIAKQYTDRVFYFAWSDDFAKARNFSYTKATKDFVMWLDADDIITFENREILKKLKNNLDNGVDYVVAQYRVHYNQDGSASLIFPKTRITRRKKNLVWLGAVHEDLKHSGHGLITDFTVDHKYKDRELSNARNMKIMKKLIESGCANHNIYYFYGMDLYSAGDFNEAERFFEMVMESGKADSFDSTQMYIALHNIYRMRGDNQNARAILEDHKNLMADKSDYYCYLGEFYLDCLNDVNTALKMYNQALRCEGKNTGEKVYGLRNPDFYYHIPNVMLGNAYLGLENAEYALIYYERALSYKKNDLVEQIVRKLKQILTLEITSNVVNVRYNQI